jgi:hypothetical protein
MTNHAIIFSKNRAAQLDLLLQSIIKNCDELFNQITVLFKSDFSYKNGYQILESNYPNIQFIPEVNFRNDTISLINQDYNYTTFLVDDDVIFSKVNKKLVDIIRVMDNSICFSLRLGLNSKYCHPADIYYEIKNETIIGDFITFNYKEQDGDLGYPLSLDGHIFKTDDIISIIKATNFYNPNSLEANIQKFTQNIQKPNITSFKYSKLVGVPVNLVNETFNNRHGIEFYISEKTLNNRFINGERIDIDKLDFGVINGPHKEIKYEFKKTS